jgi:hypothetical protein
MLVRGSLQYFGNLQSSTWPKCPSLAALPLDSELLVVNDTREDQRYTVHAEMATIFVNIMANGVLIHANYSRRFAELEKQTGARFYACAPLLSSSGNRVGAL